MYINDRLVLSSNNALNIAAVDLPAGRPVPIRVEYVAKSAFAGIFPISMNLGWSPPDPARWQAAVDAAHAAEEAVVFVNDIRTEGADLPTLSLPGDQDALIEAIAAANPHTVVVLNTGGPVLTPWRDKVAGILEAWYPGQENGNAIASVLFGDVDPSGRLPATFPKSDDQGPLPSPERFPGVSDTVRYSEGLQVGYRYYDAHGQQPAFAFGHGLSYTTFSYGKSPVKRSRHRAARSPSSACATPATATAPKSCNLRRLPGHRRGTAEGPQGLPQGPTQPRPTGDRHTHPRSPRSVGVERGTQRVGQPDRALPPHGRQLLPRHPRDRLDPAARLVAPRPTGGERTLAPVENPPAARRPPFAHCSVSREGASRVSPATRVWAISWHVALCRGAIGRLRYGLGVLSARRRAPRFRLRTCPRWVSRLSFMVGVSSSESGSQSVGRIVKRLICSTRERCVFASSIAWATSVRISSLAASAEAEASSWSRARAWAVQASGSRTISATL